MLRAYILTFIANFLILSAVLAESTIESIDALHQKADALIESGRYQETIPIYTEILLIHPEDEVAYTNMAHVHMWSGNTREAKRYFTIALEINPSNQIAQAGLIKIKDPDVDLGHLFDDEKSEYGEPIHQSPQP